ARVQNGIAAEAKRALVQKVIAQVQLRKQRAHDQDTERDADDQRGEDSEKAFPEERCGAWISQKTAGNEQAADDKERGDGKLAEAAIPAEAEKGLAIGVAVAQGPAMADDHQKRGDEAN